MAGELIDASSREPIAGGLVWSAIAELPPITASAAGPDGRFRLHLPESSSVQLTAVAPGYLAAKTAVRHPAKGLPPVRVELARAATFSGEILDRVELLIDRASMPPLASGRAAQRHSRGGGLAQLGVELEAERVGQAGEVVEDGDQVPELEEPLIVEADVA